MFDECAGNFSHKRLRAVVWLLVVIAFFVIVRQFYVSRLDRGVKSEDASRTSVVTNATPVAEAK